MLITLEKKYHIGDNIYNLGREEDPNNNFKKNPRSYF